VKNWNFWKLESETAFQSIIKRLNISCKDNDNVVNVIVLQRPNYTHFSVNLPSSINLGFCYQTAFNIIFYMYYAKVTSQTKTSQESQEGNQVTKVYQTPHIDI
jgi:hypothetical protein